MATNTKVNDHKISPKQAAIADDYPTKDNLTDEVLGGGLSTNGDLTEDVLTDGSTARAGALDLDDEGLILRDKERGTLDDERLMDEDTNNGESQLESA